MDGRAGSTTVAYRTEIAQGSTTRTDVLCASAGGALPDGVTVIGADELQVGVWTAGADPLLPGMRTAMNPAAVSALFEIVPVGVEVPAPPAEPLVYQRPAPAR